MAVELDMEVVQHMVALDLTLEVQLDLMAALDLLETMVELMEVPPTTHQQEVLSEMVTNNNTLAFTQQTL